MSQQTRQAKASRGSAGRSDAVTPAAATLAGFGDAAKLLDSLVAQLQELRELAREDPKLNPVQRLAQSLSHRMEVGALEAESLSGIVQLLTVDAFRRRADRLGAYVGELDVDANERTLLALFRKLAFAGDRLRPFADFQEVMQYELFGAVFTAHPTFALRWELRQILERLATGTDETGAPLDEAARADLLQRAADVHHAPDEKITLAFEHDQAEYAISQIQDALRRAYRAALLVAAELYPDDWTRLTPRLMTVASWVGYDLDGRTDIHWTDSLHSRIEVARVQIDRYLSATRAIAERAKELGKTSDLATTLDLLESRLVLALRMVSEESELFTGDGEDPNHVRLVAQRLQRDDEHRIRDTKGLRDLVSRAVAMAPDDAMRLDLLVLAAEMANYGLGTAHTHFRINAVQLHNGIRHAIGMEGAPDDPKNRRRYLNALTGLLDDVEPATINFGSIMAERTSARRLMMAAAMMLRYVGSQVPIRFLIAECDTPFTVLTALYFARLFGIDKQLDISPLFETATALERGSEVISELLDNKHYLAYVRARGRLCIQTGFSDAGRYLGQVAAALAIERLHMKLARLLADRGITEVQVVIFDTHGESIGRGAHPAGMEARLNYNASPASRSLFRRNGIAVKHEASFQGGDGYCLFGTPQLAFATVCRVLEHALSEPDIGVEDPFYTDTDYTLEFFLTVKHFNEAVMEDRDYGTLVGAFGTNLLHQTGSRRTKRQHESNKGVDRNHPSQVRAIPHNAVLHQLGWLANTVGGMGLAVIRDEDHFVRLYRSSDRMQRLISMVAYAEGLGSLDIMAAYADLFDPGFWLGRATCGTETEREDELRRLSRMLEQDGRFQRMARIIRVFIQDAIDLRAGLHAAGDGTPIAPPRTQDEKDDLAAIHAVRLAFIQEAFILAMRIPRFSSRHDITPEDIVEQILELDIPAAVGVLKRTFPADAKVVDLQNFGEPATYRGDDVSDYKEEHRLLFQPLLALHDLIKRTAAAVTHMIGAHG